MTNSDGAGGGDGFLVKFNSSGTLVWDRTIGGTAGDNFYSVIETGDGGFVASGNTNSDGAGGTDGFLVKVNSSGTLVWDRTIGGTSGDYFRSSIETSDGGIVVAGYTMSDGAGAYDGFLVKVNSSGTLVWDKTIGGLGSDELHSVLEN